MVVASSLLMAIATIVCSNDFSSASVDWQFRGATYMAEDGERFVRIASHGESASFVTTPVLNGWKSPCTYTVTAKVRGQGRLWMHLSQKKGTAMDYLEGLKIPKGKLLDVRQDVSTDEWRVIGMRGGAAQKGAETVRVRFELCGKGTIDVDDVRIVEDEPSVERASFTVAFDRDEIVLGEEAVARVAGTDTLADGERYGFAFVSEWNTEQHLWDERTDGRVYTVRPAATGVFTLHADVSDVFGELAARNLRLTVLPAPRPVPKKPTLNAELALMLDREGRVMQLASIATLKPRLGFREYLAVTVSNAASRVSKLVVRKACADREKDASFVDPVFVEVPSGGTCEFALPVRTFRNVPETLSIEIETDDGARIELPLACDPVETYPLFGTQEQFDRRPPGRAAALRDMRFVRELPCQLFRVPDVMMWAKQSVCPDGNWAYDFGDADFTVEALLHEGLTQVHPFLGYVPDDLRPIDDGFLPDKSARYRAYVEAFVGRYAGRVRYFEPFNEPPWGAFTDYARNGGAVLVEMQRHLHEAVKAVDERAIVVGPGFCRKSDFPVLRDFVRKGGDRWTDVYSMHEYTLPSWKADWQWREGDEREAAFALSEVFDSRVEKGEGLAFLRLLRELGVNKPCFITECGSNLVPNTELKRRMKAILCLRAHLIWLADGMAGIQQYELCDYDHETLPSHFAMVRAGTGEKLPFYRAFREQIFALTGAKTEGSVKVDGDIRYARFRRGDERILAVWNVGRNALELDETFGTPVETVLLDPFAAEFIVRETFRSGVGRRLDLPPVSIRFIRENE